MYCVIGSEEVVARALRFFCAHSSVLILQGYFRARGVCPSNTNDSMLTFHQFINLEPRKQAKSTVTKRKKMISRWCSR